MKKVLVALFLLIFVTTLSVRVSAETPVVNSFSVTSSVESGQIANLGWTINGGGHSLIIFCGQGIKLRYASTNLSFPCDTRVSISPSASDGVSLIVANISGSPRIITARIIPKDANGGVDYDAGAKESTIYVNPSRFPFETFYTTGTTTVSGSATSFFWSSPYLDGVNIRIACNDSISATSTTFGKNSVPCGSMIFPTDLPGSGSVTFKFDNQSSSDLPLEVTLFPAVSPGVYNGVNAKTITITVASDAQKPLSVEFNASRKKIFSGDSVTFNWSIVNGGGANMKFSCSSITDLKAFSAATTTTLKCDDYAWTEPFPPTGSTSVSFISRGQEDQITATLFPALKNGTYDGSKSQSIKINIAAVPNVPSSSAPQTLPQVQPPKPAQVVPTATGKNVFTKWLSVGSRSVDVTMLQKFLAKDKSIYPERQISGYFGAATKRAVGRFQLKYGLIKSTKDSIYGVLDEKTRTLLNSMQ